MRGDNLHDCGHVSKDDEQSEVGNTSKNILSANLLLITRPSPW